MTIVNRDSFLNNVAEQLGRSRRSEGVERPEWSLSPQWKVCEGYSTEKLVEVFKEQCDSIHTDFIRVGKDEVTAAIKETLDRYEAKSIIAADDVRNKTFGLDDFYQELANSNVDTHVWDPALGKENQQIAERADVGITFSDITLAESATVTLFNNKGNARTISLLPQTYIAVIPISTLVPRITQAAKIIHDEEEKGNLVSSCVSFISGPSNSADIEMELIVGVHGPVKATYILVDE